MDDPREAVSVTPGGGYRAVVIVATVVVLACCARLVVTAQDTGNHRGMWFSIAHVLAVAVGVVLSLRALKGRGA